MVAWMVTYAYFVWLGALHALGCGPDGVEMHQLLLGMMPLAIGSTLLLRVTRPLPEIHGILRWLCLPLLALLPFGIRSIWAALKTATLGNAGICTLLPSSSWELWWAPLQIATLSFCIWMIAGLWRSSGRLQD